MNEICPMSLLVLAADADAAELGFLAKIGSAFQLGLDWTRPWALKLELRVSRIGIQNLLTRNINLMANCLGGTDFPSLPKTKL